MSEPYYCPVCKARNQYYGRLVFPDETEEPTCPNHKKGMEQALLPVQPRNSLSRRVSAA